jgi:hypothetical protein
VPVGEQMDTGVTAGPHVTALQAVACPGVHVPPAGGAPPPAAGATGELVLLLQAATTQTIIKLAPSLPPANGPCAIEDLV